MSEDRGTVRAVAWLELFPALSLFSALRMGLNIRALLLAAIAIVGTSAGWRLCGLPFHDPDEPAAAPFDKRIEANRIWPWQQPVGAAPVDQLTSLETWWQQSPLIFAWNEISAPFERMYTANASFAEIVYWLLCALWSLLVWSFFGGAITRMAAVSLARQENQSWKQLTSFVRPRFAAYLIAPLFPILGTFLVAIFLSVVGLVMRAGFGVLLAGIVWPLVLLGGFAMAFLLIGLFFGWPLMWGAISAEGTDSFGALSHSYSYTYQRPLHYLLYVVAAAFIGVLGWYLVSTFAYWTITLSNWGVSWGSGVARLNEVMGQSSELGWLGERGASLVQFWNHGVRTLALAFIFSYFWSSTTVIYFLLRRGVDATEMDEVFMPEEKQLHGLPSLKTGPDGVAEVADDQVLAAEEQHG